MSDLPVLHVVLAVKFRAFGMDLANWTVSHDIPMPLPLDWIANNQSLVNLSQNGVTLNIYLDPVAPAAPTPTPTPAPVIAQSLPVVVTPPVVPVPPPMPAPPIVTP